MFEFIVPMVPKRWLNQETCKSYGGSISNGKQPTALAISVLDRKRPVMWQGKPLFTEHWCLAHFLLDGHHKTYVASQLNKPLTLLSFLAIDESISSEAEIDEVLEILRTVDNPRSNDLGTGQC